MGSMTLPRHGPAAHGRRDDIVVLLPVKRLDQAKSRLADLGAQQRRSLALAFMRDTLEVVSRLPALDEIVVATDDATVRQAALDYPGVRVAPGGDGLNEDIASTAADVRLRRPGVRLLVLCADLPALRPAEVEHLLSQPDASVAVPDRHGSGTTAILSTVELTPRFGEGSLAAHLRDGAVAFTDAGPGLRCDVDTPADLAYARGLGLGPHTRALVAASAAP